MIVGLEFFVFFLVEVKLILVELKDVLSMVVDAIIDILIFQQGNVLSHLGLPLNFPCDLVDLFLQFECIIADSFLNYPEHLLAVCGHSKNY